MPALKIPHEDRPTLGHVSLMVDTLIANATADDLRAIVRNLLASGTPDFASSFTTAARSHLSQINAKKQHSVNSLFIQRPGGKTFIPTAQLNDTLARARSLCGAGLGFVSLSTLAAVVRATIGTKWEEEGDMARVLAVIDTDIAQAIQSAKEEVEGGQIGDLGEAREVLSGLRSAVEDSCADVQSWGGEFPFERAFSSVHYWKF